MPFASSPRGPTRSSARPTWCCRRSTRWSTRSRRRPASAAVAAYKAEAAKKSDLERTELAKKKTGVFTGAYAINPVNQEQIPIWIADYVLASYGTGAIMAVPAHDERDFEFAEAVRPADHARRAAAGRLAGARPAARLDDVTEPFVGDGVAVNSGAFDGLPTPSSRRRSSPGWRQQGLGQKRVNYKLRDWLFSRQRYWGEPFPILHELDANGKPTGLLRPLPESDLPLRLPELEDFKPTGTPEPPLAKATDWLTVTLDGKTYRRETNTMPQWAGSCWYYLRYLDPQERQAVLRPGEGEILAAGRSVRRRGGARGAAPALLALLAQGAVRPRPSAVRRSRSRSWSTRA